MSNYKIKARNKKTGEIVEFKIITGQSGNKTYIPNNIFENSLSQDKFDELYEIVEDTNHPYGGMTTNWIEEIKRKFGILRKVDISINRSDNMTEVSKLPEDELIDFITTLLEKQREEYVEKVEKLKYYNTEDPYSYGYNKGVEESLTLIKSHDKKE